MEDRNSTARERFLAAKKLRTADIFVGDEKFILKEMSARQAAPFFDIAEDDNKLELMAEMVVASVYDQEGNRVFGPEDKDVVLDLGASVVTEIGLAVMELNGRSKPAADDTAKNSTAQESGLLAD